MITKNQQKSLDNLASQFERLNTPNKSSGGLINVGAIQSKFNADKKRMVEIELNNAKFSELRDKIREDAINTLNKDLVSLGLVAKANNSYMIKITIPNDKYLCYTKEISINVDIKTEIERVGNNSVHVSNEIKFVLNVIDKSQFDTIEEIIAYRPEEKNSFHGKLQWLYGEVAA